MSNPTWSTGLRRGAIRPNQPTKFEQVVSQLGLNDEADMLHSPQLFDWVTRNRDKKYVPEALLVAYNLQVGDSDICFSNFGANA